MPAKLPGGGRETWAIGRKRGWPGRERESAGQAQWEVTMSNLEELYGRAMRALALREGKQAYLPDECNPFCVLTQRPERWAERARTHRGRVEIIREVMVSLSRGHYPSTIPNLKAQVRRVCLEAGFKFEPSDHAVKRAIREAVQEGWAEIIPGRRKPPISDRVTVTWA